ncbi:MAG TPA: DinB family protein [Streptosporangiaceae bacterium]
MTADFDRAAVCAEMEKTRQDFRCLVNMATAADMRRRSDGTRWTNRQLLFHMLLGYLIVRALLVLARAFGRLPGRASVTFARLLDSARRPFHLINYLGSCAGALIIRPARMPGMLDRTTGSLERRLRQEAEAALRGGMHYPTTWDPFFTDYMTLAEIYRYPTRHYQFHRRQLTIEGAGSRAGSQPAGTPRR